MKAYTDNRFMEVIDLEGSRHIIRVADIDRVADADLMRNESIIVVAGQPLVVQTPLDTVRAIMFPDKIEKTKLH